MAIYFLHTACPDVHRPAANAGASPDRKFPEQICSPGYQRYLVVLKPGLSVGNRHSADHPRARLIPTRLWSGALRPITRELAHGHPFYLSSCLAAVSKQSPTGVALRERPRDGARRGCPGSLDPALNTEQGEKKALRHR